MHATDTPAEKDRCEGRKNDLENPAIDEARFHFKTEHGEIIQVQLYPLLQQISYLH